MISRNLNTEPKTLEKIEKNKSTTFGLLCCETGPISLDYSLNKTGFVCGEKALLNIKVNEVVLSSSGSGSGSKSNVKRQK